MKFGNLIERKKKPSERNFYSFDPPTRSFPLDSQRELSWRIGSIFFFVGARLVDHLLHTTTTTTTTTVNYLLLNCLPLVFLLYPPPPPPCLDPGRCPPPPPPP